MGTTLKFNISVDIPGTQDLKPPDLVAECEIEFSGDSDLERAKVAYYKASYEKKMTEVLKNQVKYFVVPLTSMQKDIDKLKTAHGAIISATDADNLESQIKASLKLQEQLKDELAGFGEYIKGATANTIKQQIAIWHDKFEDEAEDAASKKIKSDIKMKKVRHVAGLVLAGTLALVGTGLIIFASVATFGTVPAVLFAIGIATGVIGGIAKSRTLYVAIKKSWDLEKASVEKIKDDLEDVSNHLGKTQSKVEGLPKHLDDASRYYSERRKNTLVMQEEIKGLETELKKLNEQVNKLQGLKLKSIDENKKQIKVLTEKKATIQKAVDEALAKDKELFEVLAKAKDLVGELSKIPFTGSRSVSDLLKKYANAEGFFTGLESFNDLVSAAAGAAG